MKQVIVVGTGFSGASIARLFADNGYDVTVFERANYLGGNSSDVPKDDYFVQRHGPHIFHTSNQAVMDFLSRFTEWNEYKHKVVANVNEKYVSVPFNFKTLETLYDESRATKIKKLLVDTYGTEKTVSIAELAKNENPDMQVFANFVYKTIFETYSAKQWGRNMALMDPTIFSRVPIRIGYTDGYFADTYQAMPKHGFNQLFANMLSHDAIKVHYNTDARNALQLVDNEFYYQGNKVLCPVIYTGCIDELFDYKFGQLEYRTLKLDTVELSQQQFQPYSVVNYTVSEDFTRITEYKNFTAIKSQSPSTVITREYALEYDNTKGHMPYYPLPTVEAKDKYLKYKEISNKVSNLYLLGRLANYVYINMDKAVDEAMKLFNQITNE